MNYANSYCIILSSVQTDRLSTKNDHLSIAVRLQCNSVLSALVKSTGLSVSNTKGKRDKISCHDEDRRSAAATQPPGGRRTVPSYHALPDRVYCWLKTKSTGASDPSKRAPQLWGLGCVICFVLAPLFLRCSLRK